MAECGGPGRGKVLHSHNFSGIGQGRRSALVSSAPGWMFAQSTWVWVLGSFLGVSHDLGVQGE